MIIKPKFYDHFRCIADKCPDTCCAGWEIDVDEDTAKYYDSLSGEDGAFVKSRLVREEEGVKLCLEGERCRFLREDNLCELIIRFGDGALCDICREHPRFYCEWEDITEEGIGLCCPEAARLWLSEPCEFVFEADEMSEVHKNDDVARKFGLISALSEGAPLGVILAELLDEESDGDIYPELCAVYRELSYLNPEFANSFADKPGFICDAEYRNLAVYFIFRYYFDLGEEMCIRFTAASLIMISAMKGDLLENAVNYSKEIEYDTDNVERICDFLRIRSGLGRLCREVLR